MIPYDLSESAGNGFFVCGTSNSGITTLCKHIAKTIIDSGVAVYVVDGTKAWTVDSPIKNVVEVLHESTKIDASYSQSTVLDFSAMRYEARLKFTKNYIQTLYKRHHSFEFKQAPLEYIFLEDAHVYMPPDCLKKTSNGKSNYAPMLDLVYTGANFNLRYGVITQFPKMIDKTVVVMCQQRYIGLLTDNEDIEFIKRFVGKAYTDQGKPNTVPKLNKGQFLYQLHGEIKSIEINS